MRAQLPAHLDHGCSARHCRRDGGFAGGRDRRSRRGAALAAAAGSTTGVVGPASAFSGTGAEQSGVDGTANNKITPRKRQSSEASRSVGQAITPASCIELGSKRRTPSTARHLQPDMYRCVPVLAVHPSNLPFPLRPRALQGQSTEAHSGCEEGEGRGQGRPQFCDPITAHHQMAAGAPLPLLWQLATQQGQLAP